MINSSLSTPNVEIGKSVIVYSGGLDSTTLLYEERKNIVLAITFDYGSNHATREIACAKKHCSLLGIRHEVVSLDFVRQMFHSSLIEGADKVPTADYDEANMRSTVVPFRNGIMLAVACGLAENYGLNRVLIANHGGDHDIYPDCRPTFVEAMDATMRAGTYAGVALVAPYTHLSKSQIVSRGAELGIDYAETYSCYCGGHQHCGRCATCRERKQAFAEAGVADPTTYLA